MVNLFFIKTFVSVAKSGSFRIAAERNFITQPAVSQHIQVLEENLGAKLFERNRKKTSLTHAGQTFLPFAENLLLTYAEAKTRVGETLNKYNGTIRIATIYSIGLHELQPIIQKFLHKYPKVDVHVEYHHSNVIYEMLLNRGVDLGLVAYPQKKSGIVSKIFTEDEIILVQSPRRPVLKKTGGVPIASLNQAKFIAFSTNTPTGKMISRFLRERKISPQVIHEYDNIETLKRAVEIGMGCAFIPRNTVLQELKNRTLEIIRLNEKLNLKRPLGILYVKGKTFSKSTQTFLELITKKPA